MKTEIKTITDRIKPLLQPEKSAVLFVHHNPDGDAIGSALGLYHYLRNKLKQVSVISPNNFPDFLKWMPAIDKVYFFDNQEEICRNLISEADLAIYCDFNDVKRIEKAGQSPLKTGAISIMIDHHPQPVDFVDFIISDTSVSSTAELVFEFIEAMENGFPDNVSLADCLLTGIITDTGLFNHNSETERTFEIVGKLLKVGANKKNIIDKVYNEYPFNRMKLLGNALYKNLHFLPEFSTAYIALSKSDLDEHNHKMGDTEGFVNMALSVAGANFAGIFLEKEDHVKVSFRSRKDFDVNLFARNHYNGGGHKNASGGKSFASLNKTIENFVLLLNQYKNELNQS
jgi:phosphoesterase RecJ-like protein